MLIDKADIINIEEKLIEGIKTSNIELLDQLLHDDLLFIAPNGQTITKEMDLASHRAGEMVVDQLIPTVEEVRIIEDVATVIVVYDTKGTMLGNMVQGQFRYLRIWKMFADGLKVIGGSCFKLN
jgi:hypothetical protein